MPKKKTAGPATDTLLVELLTEELPPKGLNVLSEAFGSALAYEFTLSGFLPHNEQVKTYATPRRIAAQIPKTLARSPDVEWDVLGPSTKAPPEAIAGFARKNGVSVDKLERRATPKGEVFVARKPVKGSSLDEVLASKVEAALKTLTFPRTMRWGDGEAQFARPVHGLVMMHGKRVIPGSVLGVSAGNATSSHRFMGTASIRLANANDYEAKLRKDGHVIADFAARKSEIDKQVRAEAKRLKATLGAYQDLLDEVTALVEWPAVYSGTFDKTFLNIPQECLILSMKQHQRYFPLANNTGKLLPHFLMVSNLQTTNPKNIIHGNERVLQARLSDAKFFYDQDRKTRLEARVLRLAHVVYHNKLGSQLERVERIQLLTGKIAREIGADLLLAERAAWLSKADLLTDMVGEFPELQGIMGRYYALHDGEHQNIADAIGDQYKRWDNLDPENLESASLYLADRIEQMTGLFGIGERPTGEKDPFALRRAALGIINVFELLGATGRFTGRAVADIKELLEYSAGLFPKNLLAVDTAAAVHEFVLDRYRHQLATIYAKDVVEAVLSQKPPLVEVVLRIRAVEEFRKLPEAESLASATKRARNILRKEKFSDVRMAKSELLIEEAEKGLAKAIVDIRSKVDAHFDRRQFVDCLKTLASVRNHVDAFFDQVLVNAEDAKVRENRLALLSELDYLFNRVADISKLAT